MTEIRETLEHANEDCPGEWREEGRVNRVRVYRCPRCDAHVRESAETRMAYWRDMDARRVRRESQEDSAIREILCAGVDSGRGFQVALALGMLFGNSTDMMTRVKQEYEAMHDTEAS